MLQYQLFTLLLLLIASNAEDSLHGALKAVHRRQRDLSGYSRYDNYGNDDFSDLVKYENRKSELEKALFEYLENAQDYDPDESPPSSSFRERAEKSHNMRNIQHNPQRNYRRGSNDDDYIEFLNEMKYPSQDNLEELYSAPYKRYNYYNYNSLGYNGVGMRKRRPFSHASYYEDDITPNYSGGAYGIYKSRERRVPFYPVTKRFPVSKRSMKEVKEVNQRKVKRTDPQVEKELSQLFDNTNDNNNKENKDKTPKKVNITTKKPTFGKVVTTAPPTKQEPTTVDTQAQEQPLQMSKKSVKWSDYFGIDRRKKSSNLDNEWLINRYHKAVELSKSKKSEEYPLKNFHKHEYSSSTQPTNLNAKSTTGIYKNDKNKNLDSMEVLDEKLKSIEESIIDDTLKYTGASGAQDDIDGEEMKDVKDSIIARLATAYNVEKMRKALKEYRQSLAQRHSEHDEEYPDNEAEDSNEDVDKEKKKRVAVARKQAVDEEHHADNDEDNNIKCTESDENCAEQNYKVPKEFMEQATFEKGGCERIERACREVSLILGPYGTIFETACNMHQMCMLCSDNSWFSPTRQCNILFLSKADQMCDGDVGCQRGARESIKYLQHVDRNMREGLSVACNLECPDRR